MIPGEALNEVEAALLRAPGEVGLLFERASLLAQMGRDEEAKYAYMLVISLEPTHFGALNDLGNLLYRTHFRKASRLAYAEAVKHHPYNAIGRINYANVLIADAHYEEARAELAEAFRLAPDHPEAHRGMANLLQMTGDSNSAEAHRQKSYRPAEITVHPYRGVGEPCRVLMLLSAAGGNIPTRHVLPDTLFEVTTLVAEGFDAAQPLPRHDVVFNAIGDADLCLPALDAADRVLALTVAPILNQTSCVRSTDRITNAVRLGHIAGVRTPRMVHAARNEIGVEAASLGYPLLLRTPGYHTGKFFEKVDTADDLGAAMAQLPGDRLLAIEYLDARGPDGRSRKYRAMMIGGKVLPMHLAVSLAWKVHYFSAAMAEDAVYRREEEVFLTNMSAAIGDKAVAALEAIAAELGLDYGGIDFGLAADGSLLLFEANATMVVNPPGSEPVWDYRRQPIERIIAAIEEMVLVRAGRSR